MQAVLVLESGEKFFGRSFGAESNAAGELVFYSAMAGYQEVLCDPAHQNKLVIMTYPIIGSYGINELDGMDFQATALIVKEYMDDPSNFRSEGTLSDLLKEKGIVGISGIDTRALVKRLRGGDRIRAAVLATDEKIDYEDVGFVLECTPLDFGVLGVTGMYPETYRPDGETKYRIALYDFGTKKSVINAFTKAGAEVTVFPPRSDVSYIADMNFDALIIAGAGGELDENIKKYTERVKTLLDMGLPTLGIDMGHLMTASALGGKIIKMQKPHRSASCTVRDMEIGRVYPTQQSHIFAVSPDALPEGARVSFICQNDGTVEGLCYPDKNIKTVQFYPDEYPKEYGTGYVYSEFLDALKG
ncbi:MAG: carbamoyl phosphate synthase small subunit [Clostridia bacterium]|nr:carbamoyl phosphate synthase small subunit [Clostridia bacterium]